MVFCFELIYFCALTNQKLLLLLQCRLNTNLLFGCVKLMGYLASAGNVVSSNPGLGPLPRIKISLFLLSICTDNLISAPKIMTFISMLPSVNKNLEQESNTMQQPLYLYLSGSAFLVSFTDPWIQCVRNIQIYYFFRKRNIIIYFNSVH